MRLFVAADLPAEARDALATWSQEWARAGGWRAVPPQSLHLTLAFLGEQPEDVVDRIAEAATGAVVGVGVGRVGLLRLGRALLLPPRRPRVSTVELEEAGETLPALQGSVSAALADLGVYEPERRRYLPHVTVARRARGEAADPGQPDWDVGPFRLEGVSLYRSRLSPDGARYERLATAPAPEAP
jgi:2'-5' RNA ligase